MRAFAIVLVFYLTQARAESLETRYLSQLATAKSAARVDRLKQDYEELKVARGACRIQLHERTVPAACYASLRLENSLGLNTGTAQRSALLKKLDILCSAAAHKLQLHGNPSESGVSGQCLRNIREARAIQAYRREDAGPDIDK